jgi:hypothetical protein
MTADIDNKRLARDRIRRTEIGDLAAFRRNGGAGGNTVIAAVVETGKDAVKVGAFEGQFPSFEGACY